MEVIGREAGNPTQHGHRKIPVKVGVDVGVYGFEAFRVSDVGWHGQAGAVNDMVACTDGFAPSQSCGIRYAA
jgi:hypothetical protein